MLVVKMIDWSSRQGAKGPYIDLEYSEYVSKKKFSIVISKGVVIRRAEATVYDYICLRCHRHDTRDLPFNSIFHDSVYIHKNVSVYMILSTNFHQSRYAANLGMVRRY